jgi:hypothetical protein
MGLAYDETTLMWIVYPNSKSMYMTLSSTGGIQSATLCAEAAAHQSCTGELRHVTIEAVKDA